MRTKFWLISRLVLPTMLIALLAIVPPAAYAYVGPSAGVGLAGATIGFVVAVVSAVGVILSWPIRVMLRKIRGAKQRPQGTSNPTT